MENKTNLWSRLSPAGTAPKSWIWSASTAVCIGTLSSGSTLRTPLAQLSGRNVLLITRAQLATALALVELDGVARRIVLCTPDLSMDVVPWIISTASINTIVSDEDSASLPGPALERVTITPEEISPLQARIATTDATEWILLTSGTTGIPKLVSHTVSTLSGAVSDNSNLGVGSVWSTFYDIRRFGGLQILLRALLGGGSIMLSQACEGIDAFLARAASHGVTHISGTPSHWRRALLCEAITRFHPQYVRLSGEIADQAILDRLHAVFPGAQISHAFASTEAGVAFDVGDGHAGFPASLIDSDAAPIHLKVRDNTLRIKSNRNAIRYVGTDIKPLFDDEGFVDTADMVERRGDRYYFVGRKDGMINVGGLKVHPEEIESVITAHPAVRISRAKARNSPFVGSVVAVDVVADVSPNAEGETMEALRQEILRLCVDKLARHKVPATIRFVRSIELNDSGKVLRQ